MAEPLTTARRPDLDGRRVLVVGVGRSGEAAARLALAHGARVTLTDQRPRGDLGPGLEALVELGAGFQLGGHPIEMLSATELIILSPGVPRTIPLIATALAQEIPVWSEIELAWRFALGSVIGVTGSNGKSTVTAMIGAILRDAGFAGDTGGNLDTPFCEMLERDAPGAVHALELSSFQLESTETLDCCVAALLNITPDHMDRYRDFDAYAAAKLRLLQMQSSDQVAIVNRDAPGSQRAAAAVRGRLHWVSTRDEVAPGAFVRNGRLAIHDGSRVVELAETTTLPLAGEHNLANALTAALATYHAGCDPESIARSLGRFRGLPHRLEAVATWAGVRYFNDSKATNVDATLRALEAFEPGRIWLILGGRDKAADWEGVLPELQRRTRSVLLIGETAPQLQRLFSDRLELERCDTIERAVDHVWSRAEPGDVVLLAPACASFDQYPDFQARGEDFAHRIHHRIRKEGGHA